MHQAQASTTSVSVADTNCALDIKPTIPNGGSGGGGGGGGAGSQAAPKQREGTTSSNNNNTSSSNHNSHAHTSLNGGGLFDSSQSTYGSGYETSYAYHHQTSGMFQSTARPTMGSPSVKPQRTKPRTSAGKTMTRCGFFKFLIIFIFSF